MHRKKNSTFFSQLFLVFVGSFLFLVLVLTVIYYFGIRISLDDWNFHSGRRLQSIVLPALTQVYRRDGQLREHSVYSGLSPFLTVNMYLYVFDKDWNPVFFFVRGERVSLSNSARIREETDKIGDGRRSAQAIVNESDVIGYLSVGTFGFTYNLANRQFLRSIAVAVFFGMGIAVVLSFAISFLFSRLLSRNTKMLWRGLQALNEGNRTVGFPTKGAREIIDIGRAAQQLSDSLERENWLRKKLARDIAHDLRTPITALKTQFENMVEGAADISKKRIHSLYGEITRIENLIFDLIQLSRMENPEMSISCGEIDAPAFTRELTSLFTGTSQEANVRFIVRCDPVRFSGDENLLYRAVSNLLNNAFQHTSPGGTVVFSLELTGDKIGLTVRNTGVVDPEEIPKLFERMYRGGNSRETPGSGLGLPIARAIIGLHGGEISMVQEESETVVRMVIPAVPGGTNQDGSPRNRYPKP